MTNLFTLGAIAVKAQAQDDTFTRLPMWMWFVIGLIIVAIGVIWTLWEEDTKQKQVKPATTPEPVGGEAPPSPVREVVTLSRTVEVPVSVEESEAVPDDLRKVNGIGPKIKQVLNEHGIFTFEQLAVTDINVLEKLMEDRGWNIATWSTWPEQAHTLAEAKNRGK